MAAGGKDASAEILVASRNSSAKYFIALGNGVAAASPKAQNDRPAICQQTSSIKANSSSLPFPCSNFSNTPVIQKVPSRQGVHFPHDSCL